MEALRAEHNIRKEVDRLTHGIVCISTVPTTSGDFVRDCEGNIILVDPVTHLKWGFVKEITCAQLMLTPRTRLAIVS